MEAGACSIMTGGNLDLKFRNTTAKPDNYIFEKMVSGGYLGALWFFILRNAAAEGCFSESFRTALEKAAESGISAAYNSYDLSVFLSDQTFPEALDSSAEEQDVERATEISRAIVLRAAYFAAVMVTSIMVKTGQGRDPYRPICLCADGTTFWKLHSLKEEVLSRLDNYTSELGIHYKIIQIENAPVIGAAVAGLTNA